jgi:hypothetical protein
MEKPCSWITTSPEFVTRLYLQDACENTLDVWPALPLYVYGYYDRPPKSADDILAALRHSDRIRQVFIRHFKSWESMVVWAAMGVPFPELTDLSLRATDAWIPAVPDSFLGGSAPLLRNLELESIPFPGLPKLLLSATHLVTLRLIYISVSGYFPPKALATCLSVLTGLRELVIIFKYPHRASRYLYPLKRSVLPALTDFEFRGVVEY